MVKIIVFSKKQIIDFLKKHKLLPLFLAAFATHVFAVLIMYGADLQPFFSGGDDVVYNDSAIAMSRQFIKGNFLLEGIAVPNTTSFFGYFLPPSFAILIAAVYVIFPANMVTGALFNAFLSAAISVIAYLIVIEISGSHKKAFVAGVAIAFYPSLLLNSALLLKDALVVLLATTSLLFIIKLIKKFSIRRFIILYLLLILVTNVRFYLGYAVMITFIICWFLFCRNVEFKKKIFYVTAMVIVFGFLPQIAYDQGYWGITSLKKYVNLEKINFYREIVYKMPTETKAYPLAGDADGDNAPNTVAPVSDAPKTESKPLRFIPAGSNSNLDVKIDFKNPMSVIVNYPKSFIYVLMGPFPWQTKILRQFLALLETIPWYFLLYFIFKGTWTEIKNKNTLIFPLIIFSLIFLATIALFDTNYGNFMRVRMAAFVSLLCLFPFGLSLNKGFLKNISKLLLKHEKIFGYWRSWFHRRPLS